MWLWKRHFTSLAPCALIWKVKWQGRRRVRQTRWSQKAPSSWLKVRGNQGPEKRSDMPTVTQELGGGPDGELSLSFFHTQCCSPDFQRSGVLLWGPCCPCFGSSPSLSQNQAVPSLPALAIPWPWGVAIKWAKATGREVKQRVCYGMRVMSSKGLPASCSLGNRTWWK